MQLKTKDELEAAGGGGDFKSRDELYEAAVDIVVRERRGSVLAAAAGAGHRLRPRRPADRLHGRGRHRRPVQRLAGPRGADLARRLGSDDPRSEEEGEAAAATGPTAGIAVQAQRPAASCKAAHDSPHHRAARRNKITPDLDPADDPADESLEDDEADEE